MNLIAQFDFQQFDPRSLPLLLGLGIITLVMLRITYRRLGKRTKNQPTIEKAPRYTPYGQVAGTVPSEEMARREAEMYDAARETFARLDSKMVALAELIRQADQAADRLEAANREAADREND